MKHKLILLLCSFCTIIEGQISTVVIDVPRESQAYIYLPFEEYANNYDPDTLLNTHTNSHEIALNLDSESEISIEFENKTYDIFIAPNDRIRVKLQHESFEQNCAISFSGDNADLNTYYNCNFRLFPETRKMRIKEIASLKQSKNLSTIVNLLKKDIIREHSIVDKIQTNNEQSRSMLKTSIKLNMINSLFANLSKTSMNTPPDHYRDSLLRNRVFMEVPISKQNIYKSHRGTNYLLTYLAHLKLYNDSIVNLFNPTSPIELNIPSEFIYFRNDLKEYLLSQIIKFSTSTLSIDNEIRIAEFKNNYPQSEFFR